MSLTARCRVGFVVALLVGASLPTQASGAVRSVDAFRQSNAAFLGPIFKPSIYNDSTRLFAGAGASAAGAGDVNGDRRADLIVGMPGFLAEGRGQVGAAYVSFGQPRSGARELSALGSRGYRIEGASRRGLTGATVDRAGDFNGDGLGDVLVAAPAEGRGRGAVYVVFGSRSRVDVRLDQLGPRGLVIDGSFRADRDPDGTCDSRCELSPGARLGSAAAPAGDVNADGLDDIVVAAIGADRAAVVFGRREPGRIGFTAAGSGFRVDGLAARGDAVNDSMPVAGAGDVNRDGRADVLVGADPTSGGACGRCRGNAYLIFGKRSRGSVRVDRLGRGGIRFAGTRRRQGVGFDVAGPGDVNGDRRPDILIGTFKTAALVYGRRKPGTIRVGPRLGRARQGFLMRDVETTNVDRVGDFNRDGLADLAVSRTIVFGTRSRRTISVRNTRRGFDVENRGFCLKTQGQDCPPSFPDDYERLAGAGDINGDGRPDLIVGDASTGPRIRGAAFVIYAAGPPRMSIDRDDEIDVSRSGRITLPLLCPANTVRRCTGTVRLMTRGARPRRTILTARFRQGAGAERELVRQLPLRLTRRLRGDRTVSVTATLRARNARGRRATTTRTLTLTRDRSSR